MRQPTTIPYPRTEKGYYDFGEVASMIKVALDIIPELKDESLPREKAEELIHRIERELPQNVRYSGGTNIQKFLDGLRDRYGKPKIF